MNAPGAALWIAIFAVSVGPALEEIFFRGLLQPVAVRSAGAVAGVLIAAVPFALLHGPQYGWSWRHVLLIRACGLGVRLVAVADAVDGRFDADACGIQLCTRCWISPRKGCSLKDSWWKPFSGRMTAWS
jgi:hypothetical protein